MGSKRLTPTTVEKNGLKMFAVVFVVVPPLFFSCFPHLAT